MIPLDLWPLDGPASLLRWGILTGPRGRDIRMCSDRPGRAPCHVWYDGDAERWPFQPGWEPTLPLPLRGLGLDAALRSTGVALDWPVTEDGPAPVLERIGSDWLLSWRDRRTWFGGATAYGRIRIMAFADPAVPYAEAVALVARAVAARGGS